MAARKAKQSDKYVDPWHYARPHLAKRFLDRFREASSRRGLYFFAPRRKGKTHFLILDVAPAAVRRRYTVVYTSMWKDLNRPHHALLKSLRRAWEAKKKRRGASTAGIAEAVRTVKAKAAFKGIEVSADLEFAQNPVDPTSAELDEIENLIEELTADKDRNALLLMIDEVQHLATRPEFEVLAGLLKSISDEQSGMDLILTGSSRSGMFELFREPTPLHNISYHESFPDLDDGFIDHLAKTYSFVSGRSLKKKDLEELRRLFDQVDRSPFYLRGVMEAMILQPDLGVREASDRMMDGVAMTGRYEERWNSLKPLDRLVLKKAIEGKTIYEEAVLAEFGMLLSPGEKKLAPVSRGLVQSSVRRLTEMQYMTPRIGVRGKYEIELMGFKEWLESSFSKTEN